MKGLSGLTGWAARTLAAVACVTWPARASIELVAPADGEEIAVRTPSQSALLAIDARDRRKAKAREFKRSRTGAWRTSRPVIFKWRATDGETRPWRLCISTREDMSCAQEFDLDYCELFRYCEANGANGREYAFTNSFANLLLGRKYYWRVEGRKHDGKQSLVSKVGTFRTALEPPRWIRLEGRVRNVRDLGGWETVDGFRVRQGLVYRAQGLNDNSSNGEKPGRNRLTVEDAKYLGETLGIKTELDLRHVRETGGMKESPIGHGVKYVQSSSGHYAGIFRSEHKAAMRDNIKMFADMSNYPILFHCIEGADRTGTLAYMLLGLLGVDKATVEKEWEETFYPSLPTADRGRGGKRYWKGTAYFDEGLARYGNASSSFKKKVELYLLDCGVTADEIKKIRAIMLEETRGPRPAPFDAAAVGFTFISPVGEWRGKELAKDEGAAAFAKTVANAREVVRVQAQVSALGCFEFYVNGKLVSVSEDGNRCDFLRPGATDREKRRHSVSYDITGNWKRGAGEKNTLSAFVARSWFSDLIGSRTDVKPAFGANVRVEYSDGGVETIKTDGSWTASFRTPFARAGIYWGEVRDGRISGDAAECAGDASAEENREFKGETTPLEGPGVSIRSDLAMHPVEAYVYSSANGAKDGEYGRVAVDRRWDGKRPITIKRGERLVIDFGQNAAAIPEIVAKAKRGATLTFKGAEMLNESNGEKKRGNDGPAGSVHRANYRILKDDGALVRYTFAGKGVETYVPTFTYMGYRYAEITATGTTELYSVKSIPVTSIRKSMERGNLRCGHRGVDKLAECAKWGEYSNFLSMPTGCSGRDERNGWTADLHVFAAAAYRFADVYSFLEKWMGDMRDAQDRKGGYPNVAPRQRGNGSGYGQCGWSDAGVIVPYVSWRMTGDKAIIEENFDSMARFVAMQQKTKYKTDVAPRAPFQFADWLSYEKYETFFKRSRGKDGNVLPETKVWWDFLAGCYWLSNARMMSEMAAATGRNGEKARYDAMAAEAEAYVKGEYMKDGRLPVFLRDMQTPHLFALHLGLYVDPVVKAEAIAQLVANIESHGNRLQTGFLGTSILMDTLTYDAGRPDLAYSILLERGDPSWLQTIDNGATTIWERWDSYTKEKGFGDARMNSFNHYAYGSVVDWLYGTAAGIRPGKNGGFDKEFVLAPIPDARLGSIRAEYKTKSGTIVSEWKCENGRCRWHFEVPKGSVAMVTFNGRTGRYVSGKYELDAEL